MPREPVRLREVAEAAGVTVSTASRALHRPELVRPATRERVTTAAHELGYVPNRIARAVVTGRTGTILFVVPDLTNNLFARVAGAAQAMARTRGFDVIIGDSGRSSATEAQLIERGRRWSEGVILCMPQGTHRAEPGRTPIVTVNRRLPGSHAVLLDQALIVEQQLAHLRDLGHERIVYVDGPKYYWASHERRRNLVRLAADLSVEVLTEVPFTFDGGREVVDRLPRGTTAVVTFADIQAAGVIARATEAGVRVPDDLSVVGANDMPIASMCTPPITTMRTPTDAMGRAAVSLLLDAEPAAEGTAIVETLTSELVVRGSTAAATRRRVPA